MGKGDAHSTDSLVHDAVTHAYIMHRACERVPHALCHSVQSGFMDRTAVLSLRMCFPCVVHRTFGVVVFNVLHVRSVSFYYVVLASVLDRRRASHCRVVIPDVLHMLRASAGVLGR